jgi:hypothetical protein
MKSNVHMLRTSRCSPNELVTNLSFWDYADGMSRKRHTYDSGPAILEQTIVLPQPASTSEMEHEGHSSQRRSQRRPRQSVVGCLTPRQNEWDHDKKHQLFTGQRHA